MRTLGFDKPLYILPFDHRGSFVTKMFGWHGDLTPAQTAEIAAAKQVIYDGFKAAVMAGVAKEKAGILVDEQFGAAILRDAAANGFVTACPAEKSGQDEFDFEYGADFAAHLEAFHPTFCKVLVRYNPEGEVMLNQRQTARLKQLSDYLHSKTESQFMFELLVPAEKEQMERLKGGRKAYARSGRGGNCPALPGVRRHFRESATVLTKRIMAARMNTDEHGFLRRESFAQGVICFSQSIFYLCPSASIRGFASHF